MEQIGCVGIRELGHGSNIREIETTVENINNKYFPY